jgi:hypothetical protein
MPEASALAQDAASVRLLSDALRCGDLVEIVTQDEYTHDVVIARAGVFLAFDTT